MNKLIHRLPNIFVEFKHANSNDPSYVVPSLLSDFVYQAAKRNPSWEFKRSFDNFYSRVILSEFQVYALGHKIATVGQKSRGSNTGIYITSDGLAKVVERGATKWSSKLNVALDTFKKHVKAIAPQEHLGRINAAGTYEFSSTNRNAEREYATTASQVAGKIYSYKTPMTQEQMQALRVLGFDEGFITNLQEKLVDKLFSEEQKVLSENSLSVYEYSGVYYVGGGKDNPMYTYNTHELPSAVTEKLGLLKLVENGVLVPNVGMRCAPNEFFLLVEEKDVRQEAA